MLLADGASPIELLYDNYELFAHMGYGVIDQINLALGTVKPHETEANTLVVVRPWMLVTKQVVWMWLAAFVVLAFCLWGRFLSGKTAAGAPKGMRNFLEPIFAYIRDEIVYPNVKDPHHHDDHHDDHGHGHGHHEETHKLADKLLPFFVTLFLFFVTINLLGLIPGSATPTSAITFTGTMAFLFVFLIYVIGGMIVQKPFIIGFWKNLVPDCPLFLWPLLFVIEFIGTLTKPFALMVRLFANMTAGHCILFALAGLAVGAEKALGTTGIAVGVAPALFSTAIYGLEVFVAILQAYIFTYLSAIFIGSYLVPEH